MIRRGFISLLVMLFLAIQVGAVLHNAEHGFEAHSHHDHGDHDHGDEHSRETCDIYLFGEHNAADIPVVASPATTVVFAAAHLPFGDDLAVQTVHMAAYPRGPPAFLLS